MLRHPPRTARDTSTDKIKESTDRPDNGDIQCRPVTGDPPLLPRCTHADQQNVRVLPIDLRNDIRPDLVAVQFTDDSEAGVAIAQCGGRTVDSRNISSQEGQRKISLHGDPAEILYPVSTCHALGDGLTGQASRQSDTGTVTVHDVGIS